jgi:hypothetical protein
MQRRIINGLQRAMDAQILLVIVGCTNFHDITVLFNKIIQSITHRIGMWIQNSSVFVVGHST